MYKNYNMNQILLPLEIEHKIEKTDIAHAINEFVESIPDTAFDVYYQADGRPSYHPKMMLKIILCAYTQATFSGRRIEAMLGDSLRMMWLAQEQRPSYRTINRFRVDEATSQLLEQCYIQFRSQLLEDELIQTDAIYIDGTKIEANAQRYTFVWKKAVQTNETKMFEKAAMMYRELVEKEIMPAIEADETEPAVTKDTVIEMVDAVDKKVTEYTEAIDSSTDTAECKTLRSERKPFKQALKILSEMVERTGTYEEHYAIIGERNSYSKTDHDATFMRMKEDHMKNGQLKPGYNLQIATADQYVLGYDIYPNPTDTKTLIPFFQTLQGAFKLNLPEHIVADAGYGSEINYEYIYDELNRTPLITYTMYNKEQTRKHQKNEFNIDNWEYNAAYDYFICPNGETIEYKGYATKTDATGYRRNFKKYVASCGSCKDCPLRAHCTTSKKDEWYKTIYQNMNWEYFKGEMKRKLSEEETGKLYRQRKIDVEPVFGHLKAILGFTRMSVRGKDNVRNELGIALMAVNLRKYNKTLAITEGQTIEKESLAINYCLKFLFFLFKDLLSQALFFEKFCSSE